MWRCPTSPLCCQAWLPGGAHPQPRWGRPGEQRHSFAGWRTGLIPAQHFLVSHLEPLSSSPGTALRDGSPGTAGRHKIRDRAGALQLGQTSRGWRGSLHPGRADQPAQEFQEGFPISFPYSARGRCTTLPSLANSELLLLRAKVPTRVTAPTLSWDSCAPAQREDMSTGAFRRPGICRSHTHPLERVKGRGGQPAPAEGQRAENQQGHGVQVCPLAAAATRFNRSRAQSCPAMPAPAPRPSCCQLPAPARNGFLLDWGCCQSLWPVLCRAERAHLGTRAGSEAQQPSRYKVERAREDGLALSERWAWEPESSPGPPRCPGNLRNVPAGRAQGPEPHPGLRRSWCWQPGIREPCRAETAGLPSLPWPRHHAMLPRPARAQGPFSAEGSPVWQQGPQHCLTCSHTSSTSSACPNGRWGLLCSPRTPHGSASPTASCTGAAPPREVWLCQRG